MGEYSGKRSFGGLLVPRKGPGLVSRDAAESGDKFCNRIGCNGRLNHTRSPHNGSEKFKSSRPSFHASNGKEIVGSSTRTCSAVANTRKSFLETRKKPSSLSELDLSETSSVEDEPEVLDVVSSSSGRAVQIGNQSDAKRSGKVSLIEAGSSSIAASNSRPRKAFWQKSGISNRDAPPLGPSVPLASTSPGARNRYGLGNLRCNSASDVVVPSGGSSSESKISRRNNILKNGNPKGESCSSVCGKKMTRPSSDGTTSTQGLSISDSRQTRNGSPSGNGGLGWGRTRKSINGTTRTRLSSQGNGNGLLPKDITPQVPQPELHIGGGIPGSSHQFSAEASSSSCSTSFSSSSSSGGSSPGLMRAGPAELGIPCSLMNHDGLRRYNMGGIAEVLMALERIEQDEELTHEELLALETNIFLGGLGLYDQHRDMRLDIDNMSYEELLELEEKMGSVSTALSEEALLKCLKRSIYQPLSPKGGAMECTEDKNQGKCSICQEEYAIGDEVGKLECEHGYHVECIHQWLRLKNWCPICKGSAATSRSPSFS